MNSKRLLWFLIIILGLVIWSNWPIWSNEFADDDNLKNRNDVLSELQETGDIYEIIKEVVRVNEEMRSLYTSYYKTGNIDTLQAVNMNLAILEVLIGTLKKRIKNTEYEHDQNIQKMINSFPPIKEVVIEEMASNKKYLEKYAKPYR